ncbi:MAG: tRNA-dihydrouridine synthase family protein [Spirochaetaceae bacterium]|nr:tRNA-dihydrouridine synthase family protein [Spirochaetaceae bacterium]
MKLLLAPMATLSHEALRNLIFRYGGCDEYYCEMIHATSLVSGGKFEEYYIRTQPEPDKMVWQLTDYREESLKEASKIVSELGGIGIDINMGCPAPDIYRTGAGCAWMSKPLQEVASMLSKVKSVLDSSTTSCKRLSCKIRLGEEDFTIEKLFDYCDMLVSEGVTQITLHPRTRKEKYTRKARWEYVNQLCEYLKTKYSSLNLQIIGNGSIFSVEDAISSIKKAPNIDGIMLGRSAIQKPWLFKQISSALSNEEFKTEIDLFELAIDFMKDIENCQPQEFWKTRKQRFFIYFCDNFQFGNYLKSQLINNDGFEVQKNILQEYFEKMPSERFLTI